MVAVQGLETLYPTGNHMITQPHSGPDDDSPRSPSAIDRLVQLADRWGSALTLPTILLSLVSIETTGVLQFAALVLASLLVIFPATDLVVQLRQMADSDSA